MKTVNTRASEYDNLLDIFLKRYSPRAMSGEAVSREELMTLFEAGRWAPSSRNEQPWRFLYTFTGTPDFDFFLSFLVPNNQSWCKRAGALIIGFSRKASSDGTPNAKHSLDTGAAYENILLQASAMGLVAHPMGGYDVELLVRGLNIPDGYEVELMIAVGRPGKTEDLPEPLREREKPSQRKGLHEIVFEGKDGAQRLL